MNKLFFRVWMTRVLWIAIAVMTGAIKNCNPDADAGKKQIVNGGDHVQLNGKGSERGGARIIGYTWSQFSTHAATPKIRLSPNARSASVNFVAPNLISGMQLFFLLVVTDQENEKSAPSVVEVFVNRGYLAAQESQKDERGDVTMSWSSFEDAEVYGICKSETDISHLNALTADTCNEYIEFDKEVREHKFLNLDEVKNYYVRVSAKNKRGDLILSHQRIIYGRRYVKLGADGSPLGVQTAVWREEDGNELDGSKWSCVRDTATNLVWEVKNKDLNDIHYRDKLYPWGGDRIIADGQDSWDRLIEDSNLNSLCGFSNWRVPSRNEFKVYSEYQLGYFHALFKEFFPYFKGVDLFSRNSPYLKYWTVDTLKGDEDVTDVDLYAYHFEFGVASQYYSLGYSLRTKKLAVQLVAQDVPE